HTMQSDEGATSMELEKVLSESNRVSFASKPNFAPLKAHEISDGQVQFRKVSIPPHRYTPSKKSVDGNLHSYIRADENRHSYESQGSQG
ncbi:unnamed protein product, partial [Ilex paraguariensis]